MSVQNENIVQAWQGFAAGDWQSQVNVRDFIQKNFTPYAGDESFLAGPTDATTALWAKVMEGIKEENRTHAPVDFDTDLPATITSRRRVSEEFSRRVAATEKSGAIQRRTADCRKTKFQAFKDIS